VGDPGHDDLGYFMEVGDLDQDGRDDLVVKGEFSADLFVVLGSSLFARPPGEYPITEVADYTLTSDAGSFGVTDLRIARGMLFVSPISPYGATPTYRVPFAAMLAAGGGPHSVQELADATFAGDSPFGQYLEACDLDGDGVGDLILGEYALLDEAGRTGAVDLTTDGLRFEYPAPAHLFGPCADLDGDGRDDMTAILYTDDTETKNFALAIWYGSGWVTPTGTTLSLGEPDVSIAISGPPDAAGNVTGSYMNVSPDAVGDWNGDGHPDLALQVERYAVSELGTGSDVFLFLGEDGFRPSGTTLGRDDADLTIYQDGEITLGRPLALSGDLNGDGRDDLVLASHIFTFNEAYVRYCPLAPGRYAYTEFAQVTYPGSSYGSTLGFRTLTHGDLDGNGVQDLVISELSAEGTDAAGDVGRWGAVHVLAR
jgi:hypothetical protein